MTLVIGCGGPVWMNRYLTVEEQESDGQGLVF